MNIVDAQNNIVGIKVGNRIKKIKPTKDICIKIALAEQLLNCWVAWDDGTKEHYVPMKDIVTSGIKKDGNYYYGG